MEFVLVHGTTQSPLGWSPLVSRLAMRGHRVLPVDLPTDRPQHRASDYAAIVRDQVGEEFTAPVVVAHSGSGALLPAIADILGARHMVWLAAFIPDVHGRRSLSATIRDEGSAMFNDEWLSLTTPPTADPVLATYFLFHDCDLATLRQALTTVRLFFPAAVYDEPAPDQALPCASTFILPRQDRTLPPEWMRTTVVERLGVMPIEIDTGHCPHVSQPATLVDILEQRAG